MNYLTLVLATASWGANFNLARVVVRYLPPFTSAAVRFALAVVFTWAIFLATEKVDWQSVREHLVRYIALGIVGVFGFNVLFFMGLRSTTAVNGSLINALSPLVTAAVSSVVLHERLRANQIAGLLVSIVGIFFVVTGGSLAALKVFHVSGGDFYILLACICWASYGVLVRRFLSGSSPLATTAITMLFGTLAMIPFALAESHPIGLGELPRFVWLSLLFMAAPGAALAYLFWNRGMTAIGPTKTAIFYNLVPVFTMVFAVSAGERLTTAQAIGGMIVIAGCVLAQVRGAPVYEPAD